MSVVHSFLTWRWVRELSTATIAHPGTRTPGIPPACPWCSPKGRVHVLLGALDFYLLGWLQLDDELM